MNNMWNESQNTEAVDPEPEFAEQPYEQSERLEQPGNKNDKLSARLRQTVRGLLLALILLAPLFFLPFTAPGDVLSLNKQVLIFSLVLASAIVWLVIIVRQEGIRLKTSGLELGILAFLASGLLAAIFSDRVYYSFVGDRGFIMTSSLAIFSFLLLNFFEKREVGRIVNYFIIGSFLAVLSGMLSLYGLPVFNWISFLSYENLSFSAQFNTVGSVNNLGALAVLLAVMIAAQKFGFGKFGQNSGSKTTDYFSWFMPIIMIGGMIVSATLLLTVNWSVFYGVLTVGMIGLIASLGLAQKRREAGDKIKASYLVGPLIILTLAILFLIGSRYFNFDFPGRRNLPVEVAISQRGSFEIAKGTFSTNLPLGVGQNNFSLAFDRYKPSGINNSSFWNTRFSNAASELWNLIIQTGVVGLAGFAALLFFIFYSLFKKRTFNFGSTPALTGTDSWPAIGPVFTASLALFFLYPFNIVLSFVFWLLIGLWALAIGEEEPENRLTVDMDEINLRSILSSLVFVLVLVFGLAGGYLFLKKYQGDYYFAKAARMNLATAEDTDRAIELLGRSVNARQSDIRSLNGLAQALLTRINTELKNKTDKEEEVTARLQNLIRLTAQTAKQMIADKPQDAQNWSSAGLVYENLFGLAEGADQAAFDVYAEYLKRAPNDPAVYTRIGGVYLRRADLNSNLLVNARRNKQKVQNEKEAVALIAADYKNAQENYTKAIALKRDLASALYSLGVVYDRQAQIKNAVKQLELTRILEQNNPGLAFELGLLYYRDGQKDNALSEMARAVNLSKDYANARWYLALLLEERGRIDLAIGQLKAILGIEINKDNQTVLDKLAALEAGQRELPPARVTSKLPLEQSIRPSR